MKNVFCFLIFFIFVISCNNPKTNNISEDSVDFVLNDCEVTYKGKPLPMGKPAEEWIKILGKPSRMLLNSTFIWDELGIAVEEDGHANKEDTKKVRFLYIFYTNLDSSVGKQEKLTYADNFYDAMKTYAQDNKLTFDEVLTKMPNDKDGYRNLDLIKQHFIYPYKTYDKPVSINGDYVVKGMSLKEINKERSAKDLHKFTFADFNMNMINEQWKTKGDNGEYWEDEKIRECPNQKFALFNSVRYSDYELEFIRVSLHEEDNHTPPIYYN